MPYTKALKPLILSSFTFKPSIFQAMKTNFQIALDFTVSETRHAHELGGHV